MANVKAAADSLRKYQKILKDADCFVVNREIVLSTNNDGQLVFDKSGVLCQRARNASIVLPLDTEFEYPRPIEYEEAATLFDLKECGNNIAAFLQSIDTVATANKRSLAADLETVEMVAAGVKLLQPKPQRS